jgi:hypothetical protein
VQRAWAVRYFALAGFLATGIYFTSSLLHPHLHQDEGDGEGISAEREAPRLSGGS